MSLQTKYFLISLILIASSLFGFGQNTHASKSWYVSFFQLKTQTPAEELLKTDSAKLNEALETHDLKTAAHVSMEMGLINLTRARDYEKAMDFFIQSLAIEDSLKLLKEQVFTHLAIGQVLEEVKDYPKSAESLEQALLANRLSDDDPVILVMILNKLGEVNALWGKIDDAFGAYQQVLNFKEEVNDPGVEAEALFNIANLYKTQGSYAKALDRHKEALALRRAMNDKKNEAQSLNDIGELYRLMKNNERALANHVAALEMRLELKDKFAIAESYNNIGALYFDQRNIERAIANLDLALAAGRESPDQDNVRRSYELLSQCYKALGDYRQALEYQDQFVNLNEFLLRDENAHQLLEDQNRYNIGQKQAQIRKLDAIRQQREHELQEQKKFRNFLIAVVSLILVVVLLVIYMYWHTQKSNKRLSIANAKIQQQNEQLQELNATKDKFFSIISHDLKGPLNSFTSFSGLLMNHTDSLSKDEIKMLAKDLDKSLKNLFALLENLLEWSRSQTGNIQFKAETFDLVALLEENKSLLQSQAQNKKITIVNAAQGDLPVQAHKHSINTVIRNLISNAIKFTPAEGAITLAIAQSNEEYTISITDTGVGMTQDILQKLFRIDSKHSTKGTADEKGTGLGLILCKDFVEKNGGKIWVKSEEGKGSVFGFTLPRQNVAVNAELVS
jgi:signal transduction histidine kinase